MFGRWCHWFLWLGFLSLTVDPPSQEHNGGLKSTVYSPAEPAALPVLHVSSAWFRAALQRIGAEPEKLKTYALTYAKGQTSANGIVLLYGAGQAWPHVLGDFRLGVPAAVFAKYLRPQWKAVFTAG